MFEIFEGRDMRGLFLYTVSVLLFTSCWQQETIKVGTSLALSSSGLFLAQEYGYFSDRGLEVELVPFQKSGAPMTVLLNSGELDVAGGNLTAGLFKSIAESDSSRIVADKGSLSDKTPYISLVAGTDFEPKDGDVISALKGKKVGLTSLSGVSQEIALDKFLGTVGLGSSDIEPVKLSYPSMNLAIMNKDIDAAVQLEPYVTYGVSEKMIKVVASMQDFYPNQQSAAIIYSKKFLAQEEAVKFMEAYLLGVRKYHDAFFKNIERDEVIEKLKKHIMLRSDLAWENMTPVGLDPDGFVDAEMVKADVEWYKSNGYVDFDLEGLEFVDQSIARRALKTIGSYDD